MKIMELFDVAGHSFPARKMGVRKTRFQNRTQAAKVWSEIHGCVIGISCIYL